MNWTKMYKEINVKKERKNMRKKGRKKERN